MSLVKSMLAEMQRIGMLTLIHCLTYVNKSRNVAGIAAGGMACQIGGVIQIR